MLKDNSLKESFFWKVLNTIGFLLINGVFLMIMARLLPKEIHGAFVIINSIVILLSFLTDAGLGSALVQKKEINEYHIGSANILVVLFGIVLFVLVLSSSNVISNFYDNKFSASHLILLTTNFFLIAVKIVPHSLLVKTFNFKLLFICNIISEFCGKLLLGTYLAYKGYGLWSFIIAFLVANLINVILLRWKVKKANNFLFRKGEANEVLMFGIPMTGVQILSYFNNQIDKFLIGRIFGMSSLAIYEKGFYISYLPSKFTGGSIDSVLFSFFSKIQNDKATLRKIYYAAFICLFSFGCYTSLLSFFFSHEIVKLILGNSWGEAELFLKVIAFNTPFIATIRLTDILARSTFNLKYSIYGKSIYTLLIILACLSGAYIELLDVAKCILLSSFIYFIFMSIVANKLVSLSWHEFMKTVDHFIRIPLYFIVKLGLTFFIFQYLEIWGLLAVIFIDLFVLMLFRKNILSIFNNYANSNIH